MKNMEMRIKSVRYSLTFDRVESDYCPRRLTYGIAARGPGKRMVIRDISTRRPEVEALILRLNRSQVSLCHFRDIIDDSLGV